MNLLLWLAALLAQAAHDLALPIAEGRGASSMIPALRLIGNLGPWCLYFACGAEAVMAFRTGASRMRRLGIVLALALLWPGMMGQGRQAMLPAVAAGTLVTYLLAGALRQHRTTHTQLALLTATIGGTLHLAVPVLARAAGDVSYLPSGLHAAQAALLMQLGLLAWLSANTLAAASMPRRLLTAALWGAFFTMCLLRIDLTPWSSGWGAVREVLGPLPAGMSAMSVVILTLGTSLLQWNSADGGLRALLALTTGIVHPPAMAVTTLAAALTAPASAEAKTS